MAQDDELGEAGEPDTGTEEDEIAAEEELEREETARQLAKVEELTISGGDGEGEELAQEEELEREKEARLRAAEEDELL